MPIMRPTQPPIRKPVSLVDVPTSEAGHGPQHARPALALRRRLPRLSRRPDPPPPRSRPRSEGWPPSTEPSIPARVAPAAVRFGQGDSDDITPSSLLRAAGFPASPRQGEEPSALIRIERILTERAAVLLATLRRRADRAKLFLHPHLGDQ